MQIFTGPKGTEYVKKNNGLNPEGDGDIQIYLPTANNLGTWVGRRVGRSVDIGHLDSAKRRHNDKISRKSTNK
jgi:hypothetical protein